MLDSHVDFVVNFLKSYTGRYASGKQSSYLGYGLNLEEPVMAPR